MNKNYKLLILLMAGCSVAVNARVSNVNYDSTNTTGKNIPTLDPAVTTINTDTLLPTENNVVGSRFISYYNPTADVMVLAEDTTTGKDEKSVMVASRSGDKIVVNSLAPTTAVKTDMFNAVTGVTAISSGNLQDLTFDRISGGGSTTVLRDAVTKDRLLVVNNQTANFLHVALKDGAVAKANIDNFCVVGDKIVCGVFQSGQLTYDSQLSGRIRVASLTNGEQLGVAKRNMSGTYQEMPMHAGTGALPDGQDLEYLVSKVGDHCEVEKIGAMHWDAELQRLFISFTREATNSFNYVRRPFVVGRFSGNDLLLEALTPGNEVGDDALPAAASASTIHSWYDDKGYSVPFLKTMHIKATKADGSAVNYPYLISQINYNVSTPTLASNCRVFATPLVSSSSATAVNLGKAANVAALDSATPGKLSELYLQDPTSAASDIRALVGGNALPVSSHVNINGVEVVGHTVLVATAAESGTANQIGIWASTAIIDDTGKITGWTPWTRTAGVYEQVFGLGVNQSTGQLWALHGDTKSGVPAHIAAVSLPDLGIGKKFTAAITADTCGLGSLAAKVETDFTGPIFTVKHFHANRVSGLNGNSLTAFGGDGQLAVANVGGTAGVLNEFYTSIARTDLNSDNAANYKLFDNDDVVKALGKVYAIEFSRIRTSTYGWLFAGGENGLIVFSDGTTGNGPLYANFNNLTTAFAAFPARKFAKVSGPVVGLTTVNKQVNGAASESASTQYLWVATQKQLFRIPLITSSLTDAGVAAYDPTDAVNNLKMTLSAGESFLHFSMLANSSNSVSGGSACGVLVSTKNLYLLNNLDSVALAGVTVTSVELPFSKNIRSTQMLVRGPYNNGFIANTQFGTAGTVVANLLITTGSFASPASEIYSLPLLGVQTQVASLANSGQNCYTLTGAGLPLKIADSSNFGLKTLYASSLAGLPLALSAQQNVGGRTVEAQLSSVSSGSQMQSFGAAGFASLADSSGGAGGAVLANRAGNVWVQE